MSYLTRARFAMPSLAASGGIKFEDHDGLPPCASSHDIEACWRKAISNLAKPGEAGRCDVPSVQLLPATVCSRFVPESSVPRLGAMRRLNLL